MIIQKDIPTKVLVNSAKNVLFFSISIVSKMREVEQSVVLTSSLSPFSKRIIALLSKKICFKKRPLKLEGIYDFQKIEIIDTGTGFNDLGFQRLKDDIIRNIFKPSEKKSYR
jgi:hypothetical protein